MKELINAVVEARQRAATLKGQHDDTLARWTAAHGELINALAAARGEVEKTELALRTAALDTYRDTGDKHPAPGVEVKMGTKLVYQEEGALAWAKEHGICLSLDRRAFEKVAKASDINDNRVGLRVEGSPFVALATELKAL